jgi:predicted RNase H-like nuclease (RuvC/YqgF family)|tara:strand:+ start:1853 stop:2137 length:285 start_codon:yes stop_codon:yes gene_type:complete
MAARGKVVTEFSWPLTRMTDQIDQAPTVEELQESIEELSAYRERLYNDVVGLGKKLRLSQKKIEATIKDHPELSRIDEILSQLKQQRDFQANNP